MTLALIQSDTVVAVWETVPNPLVTPTGETVYCAGQGWSYGNYAIVPASYTDTPPVPPTSVTGQTYVVIGSGVNATVEITRTWEAAAASPAPAIRPVGVPLNSSSSPSINAIYPIDSQSLAAYSDLALQTKAFGAFPGGTVLIAVSDTSGIPHNFTVSEFQAFYNALVYYSEALASGQSPGTPLAIQ